MWRVIIDELHQIKFIPPRVTAHITILIKCIYKFTPTLYINLKGEQFLVSRFLLVLCEIRSLYTSWVNAYSSKPLLMMIFFF